jgi:predicted Zn-dependent protease
MMLGLFNNPRGSPADLARERLRLGSSTEILSMTNNGLPTAVATSTTHEGKPFRAGVIYHDNKAYLLAGSAESREAFEHYRESISSAIESFRPLMDAEKQSIRALEIRTIKATKGLTYRDLAQKSPLSTNAESYLRLLNGQYPEGEPDEGQIIKIIK